MLHTTTDVEVQSDMDLSEAHAIATRLEQAVLQNNKHLHRVTTHLEAPNNTIVRRQDVTPRYRDMAANICRIADRIAGPGSTHDIHLYRSRPTTADLDKQRG